LILRYSDNLKPTQVSQLEGRLTGRRILKIDYEHSEKDNYFTLRFDDETKLTIYYPDGSGSLVIGEGFP
jgi:hypothetical protein